MNIIKTIINKHILHKKYEMILCWNGFYQIRALRDIILSVFNSSSITFKVILKGELGGYIENESCLSQKGNCWIDKHVFVYKNVIIQDNAYVCYTPRSSRKIIQYQRLNSPYTLIISKNSFINGNINIDVRSHNNRGSYLGNIILENDLRVNGDIIIDCENLNPIRIREPLDFYSEGNVFNNYNDFYNYVSTHNNRNNINNRINVTSPPQYGHLLENHGYFLENQTPADNNVSIQYYTTNEYKEKIKPIKPEIPKIKNMFYGITISE